MQFLLHPPGRRSGESEGEMMKKKQLNMFIRGLKISISNNKGWVKKSPYDKNVQRDLENRRCLLRLLESIRDTQTTADEKIALRGDEVWLGDDFGGVFSERVYVSSDCTDKQISTTYSSEAALKRAMKKASGK
jgi:hypothetical protein